MVDQAATPDRLLTYTEAGQIAGVSHTTIGKWVKGHGLIARRMPGSQRNRIRAGDLVAYLRALPADGEAESSESSESSES